MCSCMHAAGATALVRHVRRGSMLHDGHFRTLLPVGMDPAVNPHIATAHACFRAFDEGHKGYLTARDLKYAWAALFAYKPTKRQLQRMMEGHDDRSTSARAAVIAATCCICIDAVRATVSLAAFVELVQANAAADADETVRDMFQAMDTRLHGFLTAEDLEQVRGSDARERRGRDAHCDCAYAMVKGARRSGAALERGGGGTGFHGGGCNR